MIQEELVPYAPSTAHGRSDNGNSPGAGFLDSAARRAMEATGCGVAVISLVDAERIGFRTPAHVAGRERAGRRAGLCGMAVRDDDPWAEDLADVDPRTLANALGARALGLNFYVGVPLRSSYGHDLGTLAVLDRAPRSLPDDQLVALKTIAASVVHALEARAAQR